MTMNQHIDNDAAAPPWPAEVEASAPASSRQRRIACAALALAIIAAGCGGGGDDPPAPAPAPAPVTPRTCGDTDGPATGGLDLSGTTSISGLSLRAGASGTVLLDPGEVSYVNAALPSTAVSGTLRVSLWASNSSYTGGTLTGQLVARSVIAFSNGTSQLGNGKKADLPATTLSTTSPSRGSYCMVITLDEYGPSRCSSSDGYCIVDWTQFVNSLEFQ